jgi:hypothetical protein
MEYRAFVREKIPVLMNNVVANSFEVAGDRWQIRVGTAHRLIATFQEIGHQLVIQLAQLVFGFFFEAVDANAKFSDLAL